MQSSPDILHLDDNLPWKWSDRIRRIVAVQFDRPDVLTVVGCNVSGKTIVIKGPPAEVIVWLAQHTSRRKMQDVFRMMNDEKTFRAASRDSSPI